MINTNKSEIMIGFNAYQNDHKYYRFELFNDKKYGKQLEIRSWIRYGNNPDYIPTKQSIYIGFNTLRDQVMDNLTNIVKEYDQKV